MFLIPLILSAGLDLSLPEFQPYEDPSGNYLVSEFDVSSNEDVVISVPKEEIIINDVSDNETKSDVTDNDKKGSSDNDKKSVIKSADPAPAMRGSAVTTISYTYKQSLAYASTGYVASNGAYSIVYFYLPEANTYTLNSNLIYSSAVFFSSVEPSSGSAWTRREDNVSSPYTFTVGSPCYIGFNLYGTSPDPTAMYVTYTPSSSGGDDISGSDYSDVVAALATINDNVVEINDKLDGLSTSDSGNNNVLRAIMFIVLMEFLYPIALSIVHNIIGGDKNV